MIVRINFGVIWRVGLHPDRGTGVTVLHMRVSLVTNVTAFLRKVIHEVKCSGNGSAWLSY